MNSSRAKTEQDIINFLRAHGSRGEIGPSSVLQELIPADGDDAVEIIVEYADTFGVDLSQFVFERYFTPEYYCTFSLWRTLLGLFGFKDRNENPATGLPDVPITVTDLIDSALNGRWTKVR